MSLVRHIAVDLLRALAVLTLVFLSFGHSSAGIAAPHGPDLLTAAVDISWCGDTLPADDQAHAPCHACRVLGTALPPAVGGLIDRPLVPCAQTARAATPAATAAPADLPEARGPPRLA